jgi:hypothetical protein
VPKLTKMSSDEVEGLKKKKSGQNERQRTRQQYIAYLKNFNPGDWVSVELEESEKRQTIKNRLKNAAKDVGYNLNFMRTRNGLKFEIQKAE